MTYDEWHDVFMEGIDKGWISAPACATHDGVPSTESEEESWEQGWDPCQPIVRLWGPEGKAGVEADARQMLT